jgi:6-phosphogluconolactonase
MAENITRWRKPDYLMVVSDVNALNRAAVDEIKTAAEAAIRDHGRFTIALSGGNTPRAVYSLLAENKIGFPWAKAFFFFGDERPVPPDHPDSNYRMVHEALLSRAAVPAENIFRVPAELGAAKAAERYEAVIREFFKLQPIKLQPGKLQPGQLPRFDLILLGMGDEGHTASLFPGSPAMAETSRLVVSNWVEKLNTDRITFTFPVINNAGEALFMVAGAGKAEIVKEVFITEGEQYPVQRVHPHHGRLLWIVDQAAASLL